MPRARLTHRRPLTDERGRFVRAGSGLAWWGERLAVVQDDTRSLALVEPETLAIEWVAFGPSDPDAKRDKLDLEALVAFEDALYGIGSGSTPNREVIARVQPGVSCTLYPAPELYALLRESHAFCGSELNLEGATLAGGELVLLQRGNGKPRNGRSPVDASGRLDFRELVRYLEGRGPLPKLRDVKSYDLGRIRGVRSTFTDACAHAGRVFYLACAEDSPDAYSDGAVAGSSLGVLGGARVAIEGLETKAEGLALLSDTVAFVVTDADDPEVPAELCKLELSGFDA